VTYRHVARQQRGKHSSTKKIVTVGNGVFYTVRAEEYLEDRWGDPVIVLNVMEQNGR
jgi:hypothetical protein